MTLAENLLKTILKRIIRPTTSDKEIARREFILNIILFGLIILAGTAFTINILHPLLYAAQDGENPLVTGSILTVLICLLTLSKKNHSRASANTLVFLLLVISIYSLYQWGADLAINLLLIALVTVIAGILVSNKAAIAVTIISTSTLMIFTYLEVSNITHPNLLRKTETIHVTDSFVNVIFLFIIASVSWLFNRDIEQALKRARNSEAALKRQRDQLEIKVEERTRQLRQAQAEKLSQLYRFAEIGRSASGILHDLSGPLSLISINLDRLNSQSQKLKATTLETVGTNLERAIIGTRRIESFIQAAKKQIQDQKVIQKFSLVDEIKQVIQVLQHRAKENSIQINLIYLQDVKVSGNPIKFYQLVTNLLSNAIDSFESKQITPKKIDISLTKDLQSVILQVIDNGVGISPHNIAKIFEPLFTTKPYGKGIGLGLSISKEIVEKDLKGTITVDSKIRHGTIFTVMIPITKKNKVAIS